MPQWNPDGLGWRAMPIEMVRPFNRRAKRGLEYGKVAVPVLFVALKAYFWMR